MTEPLAFVLYEKLLPGTQLVNRLQDLRYRVHVVTEPATLAQRAEELKPMVVLADLHSTGNSIAPALATLRQNTATSHIPVIGFTEEESDAARNAAEAAGVTLFATDAAVLNHLPLLLEQALRVD
jgi:CheY-like chemotaxis protein